MFWPCAASPSQAKVARPFHCSPPLLVTVLALVVSMTGEPPVTVTISATVASGICRSSGTVASTCTVTFSRAMVLNPCSSRRTEYTPGDAFIVEVS